MDRIKYNRMQVTFDNLCTDLGWISLNKKNETICGDYFNIVETDEDHVLVLSDGLGSGCKANILSTLTAQMLSTMIAKKIPVHDAVLAVADTLPICSVRQLAYATFTVLNIKGNVANLQQFDNPDAILIRNGKIYEYPYTTSVIGEKIIHESSFPLQEEDMLILMSDGVTNAGMGKTTNGGWGREDVVRFCQEKYRPGMSSQEMAINIAYAGLALNMDETDDDLTVIVLRFCRRQIVNLMIGPPRGAEDDNIYMKKFFENEGRHVICGGTTAKIASRYLKKPLITVENSDIDGVPSRMRLEGVDLATEGLLTLERLLEYCDEYLENRMSFHQMLQRKDSASLLGVLLFSWATDIHLFFGNAYNPAYEGTPINPDDKKHSVELLMKHLKNAGKNVQIDFWET